jgi:hypothetical protein
MRRREPIWPEDAALAGSVKPRSPAATTSIEYDFPISRPSRRLGTADPIEDTQPHGYDRTIYAAHNSPPKSGVSCQWRLPRSEQER